MERTMFKAFPVVGAFLAMSLSLGFGCGDGGYPSEGESGVEDSESAPERAANEAISDDRAPTFNDKDLSDDTEGTYETTAGYSGFYVDGRFLRDRCGKKVVLRGVNEMIVWSAGKDGVPEFAEIAKTGANSVRIVWLTTESSAGLDKVIQNALAQKLIPMVELHDATGDFSKLPSLVNYWTRWDVVNVIKKHEQNILVNIGNEVGNGNVSNTTFRDGYKQAITKMRAAGIRTPLIIDATTWGQNIDQLQAVGPTLIAHDPSHNIMLSVHMWWVDGSAAHINNELAQSVQLNLPLIVGEFAQHAVYQCSQNPFDYKALLAKSKELEIGWLAWSWGGINNSDCSGQGSFDMTVGGVYGSWKETWGRDVAVMDAYSIKNTSVRPASIVTGSCQ